MFANSVEIANKSIRWPRKKQQDINTPNQSSGEDLFVLAGALLEFVGRR